jgi:hypothetical protein
VRLRVLVCPRCGAPLPKRAALVLVVCEYCKSEVTVERYAVKAADYRRTLEEYVGAVGPDIITVESARFRLLERIATGHSADVWRAQRATRLSERVIVKILREPADEPLLRNEQSVLAELANSGAKGSDFFAALLPQRAGFGVGVGPSTADRLTAVFREPAGFSHTLSAVQRAYPDGIDVRHLVWVWRRSLELLGWLHLSGFVHGALLPEHLLINARDHALRFVGFSCAGRSGARLAAVSAKDRALYPESLLNGGGLSTDSDRIMLARVLLQVWGAEASRAGPAIPAELARLLEREADGASKLDAWALSEEVSAAAKRCFGPPKFVALRLP